MTPSLTSQTLDDKMGWACRAQESQAIEAKAVDFLPHWEWVDLDSHGYVVVDVTPERVTAEFWHLDTILARSPHEELGARFTVPHGAPRLVRDPYRPFWRDLYRAIRCETTPKGRSACPRSLQRS